MANTTSIVLGAILALSTSASYAQNKDPRLQPKKLSAVGDSITEAINAEEFNLLSPINPNHWASYSNGYHGFWEWLLGRTDVNSHNQRITTEFGSSNRKNYMEGLSGADSFDLLPQMQQSVAHGATYVPVLMGHNDVCQNDFAEIPTDEQFEANVRSGLDALRSGLPNGATIYILAIVDIYRLYQLGQNLTSLGLIDCNLVWAATLLNIYPCGTMLSPTNSEADRQYTRGRLFAFNDILARVVNEYEQADPHHYYAFTDATFNYTFTPSQVSGFDCFHPSAQGQRELARVTWESGPFGP